MYLPSLPGHILHWLVRVLVLPLLGLLAPPRAALAARAWPLGGIDRQISVEAAVPRRMAGTGVPFRALTLATVITIFALVVLGGVVRLTGSGLGCPDWPLCHGKLIPSLDTPTLIEYSHRLLASIAGGLVLATAIVVWRCYREHPWLLIPSSLGLLLLATQVILGGFTVLEELSSGLVLAHLATAEALMASVVVVCLVALRGAPSPVIRTDGEKGHNQFPLLVLAAMLAVYGVLLTGSYVTVSGSTTACGQWWPLCQGQLFAEGHYPILHMVHRIAALLAGLLIVSVVLQAWRRKNEREEQSWVAAAVAGLFLVQISVGAAILWAGFPLAARLLHLAMATVVWVALAALAVLALTPSTSRMEGIEHA